MKQKLFNPLSFFHRNKNRTLKNTRLNFVNFYLMKCKWSIYFSILIPCLVHIICFTQIKLSFFQYGYWSSCLQRYLNNLCNTFYVYMYYFFFFRKTMWYKFLSFCRIVGRELRRESVLHRYHHCCVNRHRNGRGFHLLDSSTKSASVTTTRREPRPRCRTTTSTTTTTITSIQLLYYNIKMYKAQQDRFTVRVHHKRNRVWLSGWVRIDNNIDWIERIHYMYINIRALPL
jgi:hypothetical protein